MSRSVTQLPGKWELGIVCGGREPPSWCLSPGLLPGGGLPAGCRPLGLSRRGQSAGRLGGGAWPGGEPVFYGASPWFSDAGKSAPPPWGSVGEDPPTPPGTVGLPDQLVTWFLKRCSLALPQAPSSGHCGQLTFLSQVPVGAGTQPGRCGAPSL